MIETVNKETMESLKKLADINSQVSEAKATLIKLQSTKDEYILNREKETTLKIDSLLEQSKENLDKIRENNQEVTTLFNTIVSVTGFLEEIHENYLKIADDFTKKTSDWSLKIEKQEKILAEERKIIETDKKSIAIARELIAKRQKHLSDTATHIASQQQQIKNALALLK